MLVEDRVPRGAMAVEPEDAPDCAARPLDKANQFLTVIWLRRIGLGIARPVIPVIRVGPLQLIDVPYYISHFAVFSTLRASIPSAKLTR
jgi:hypothetical protein